MVFFLKNFYHTLVIDVFKKLFGLKEYIGNVGRRQNEQKHIELTQLSIFNAGLTSTGNGQLSASTECIVLNHNLFSETYQIYSFSADRVLSDTDESDL